MLIGKIIAAATLACLFSTVQLNKTLETYPEAVRTFIASFPLLQAWPKGRPLLLKLLEKESRQNLILPAVCAVAVGGEAHHAIPVSAAWTALNQAGHLMDAVQDNDEWVFQIVSSPAEAINSFTGLIFLAFHFLERIPKRETSCAVKALFSEVYFHATVGQSLSFTTYEKLPLEEALETYWLATISKAGNMFRAATAGGAMVGLGSKAQVTALGDYGLAMGTIFQILDDCRDIFDEAPPSGRSEMSLPLLLYYAANPNRRTEPSAQNRKELAHRLKAAGVQEMLADILGHWRTRAMTSLQTAEDEEAAGMLGTFIEHILSPEKKT